MPFGHWITLPAYLKLRPSRGVHPQKSTLMSPGLTPPSFFPKTCLSTQYGPKMSAPCQVAPKLSTNWFFCLSDLGTGLKRLSS